MWCPVFDNDNHDQPTCLISSKGWVWHKLRTFGRHWQSCMHSDCVISDGRRRCLTNLFPRESQGLDAWEKGFGTALDVDNDELAKLADSKQWAEIATSVEHPTYCHEDLWANNVANPGDDDDFAVILDWQAVRVDCCLTTHATLFFNPLRPGIHAHTCLFQIVLAATNR